MTNSGAKFEGVLKRANTPAANVNMQHDDSFDMVVSSPENMDKQSKQRTIVVEPREDRQTPLVGVGRGPSRNKPKTLAEKPRQIENAPASVQNRALSPRSAARASPRQDLTIVYSDSESGEKRYIFSKSRPEVATAVTQDRNETFAKFLEGYCKSTGLDASEYRVMFKGREVRPGDTANSLGMKSDGDELTLVKRDAREIRVDKGQSLTTEGEGEKAKAQGEGKQVLPDESDGGRRTRARKRARIVEDTDDEDEFNDDDNDDDYHPDRARKRKELSIFHTMKCAAEAPSSMNCELKQKRPDARHNGSEKGDKLRAGLKQSRNIIASASNSSKQPSGDSKSVIKSRPLTPVRPSVNRSKSPSQSLPRASDGIATQRTSVRDNTEDEGGDNNEGREPTRIPAQKGGQTRAHSNSPHVGTSLVPSLTELPPGGEKDDEDDDIPPPPPNNEHLAQTVTRSRIQSVEPEEQTDDVKVSVRNDLGDVVLQGKVPIPRGTRGYVEIEFKGSKKNYTLF